MCPDREVLSAYLDGEVDIKWAKEIQKHLSECQSCSEYLGSLKKTRSLLSRAGAVPEEESRRRSWAAIQEQLEDVEPSFFRRRFQLPAPLAAAAAALLLFFSGAFIYNMNPGRQPVMVSAPAVMEAPVAASISAEDMLRVLSLLESAYTESQVVMFELPTDSVFELQGEPQMIQAVDYDREDQ